MVTNTELGWVGEELAVRHLRRRGLVVLDRNWRCARREVRGELDVVAKDGDTLVFCEVKTRRGQGTGGPLAAVTVAKRRQLRRLAAAYLAQARPEHGDIRFDVVAVTLPPTGGTADIAHVEGVCT
jgi:putative endonuclease